MPHRNELLAYLRGEVDIRLPGKGNSNSHGARPVHLIITTIQWIRTSRLSRQNSLCLGKRDAKETGALPHGNELFAYLRASFVIQDLA